MVFVEPFAGGAIVGLTVAFENLAERVILAELDPDVGAVWRTVLNGRGLLLAQRISTFDFTPLNVRNVLASRPKTILDRAFVTILRNRVQHGGILAPGASLMREGENGKGMGSRWYPETLANRIKNITAVKSRIGFISGDAFDVIESYRSAANATFFVDPPYTIAGHRLYRYAQVDHQRLFRLMASVAGDFLMTYDDTPEVRNWAASCGFEYQTIAMKSRQHTHKSELLIGRHLGWLYS